MATHILDTGEAFLSADDKRFARVELVHQPIEHDPGAFRLAPALAGAVVTVAIAGLTLAAFSV